MLSEQSSFEQSDECNIDYIEPELTVAVGWHYDNELLRSKVECVDLRSK